MGKKFMGVIIKQAASKQPRDISATARYMVDLAHEGHKVPSDEHGPLSGAMNCTSKDRREQLREIEHTLRLHGNLKSKQAAAHQILSYPAGFIPTRAQIERDIRILLKKYGMSDHPLVWDCHSNTDNLHIHLLLSRVSLAPDVDGKYPIANDGLIQKKCIEKDDAGKITRTRMLTDWAGCRQSAIAEIGETYGWGLPRNVRMTPDGKPLARQDPKDRQSDKTRAGERKSGKKSKERQLAEAGEKVFSTASDWADADRRFAAMCIQMVFTTKNGKPNGGYLAGPDGRKCAFHRCGEGCSYPALEKRFGRPPSLNDAACINEYEFEPFEYRDDLTKEEARKHLLPIFSEALRVKNWAPLLEGVEHLGMRLKRSGGGLITVFNDGRDFIKASEIGNKFSLSRLEREIGPCPLPKSAPTRPSAQNLLVQDTEFILRGHVSRGRAFHHDRSALQQAVRQHEAWRAWAKAQAESSRQRRESYEAEARLAKERKINNLSFLAAVARFLKLQPKEASHVHANSPSHHQGASDLSATPSPEPVLVMR